MGDPAGEPTILPSDGMKSGEQHVVAENLYNRQLGIFQSFVFSNHSFSFELHEDSHPPSSKSKTLLQKPDEPVELFALSFVLSLLILKKNGPQIHLARFLSTRPVHLQAIVSPKLYISTSRFLRCRASLQHWQTVPWPHKLRGDGRAMRVMFVSERIGVIQVKPVTNYWELMV